MCSSFARYVGETATFNHDGKRSSNNEGHASPGAKPTTVHRPRGQDNTEQKYSR